MEPMHLRITCINLHNLQFPQDSCARHCTDAGSCESQLHALIKFHIIPLSKEGNQASKMALSMLTNAETVLLLTTADVKYATGVSKLRFKNYIIDLLTSKGINSKYGQTSFVCLASGNPFISLDISRSIATPRPTDMLLL